jgi:hypothetical protein
MKRRETGTLYEGINLYNIKYILRMVGNTGATQGLSARRPIAWLVKKFKKRGKRFRSWKNTELSRQWQKSIVYTLQYNK